MNIIKGILGLGIGFGLGSLGWVLWQKYKAFKTKVAEAKARVAPWSPPSGPCSPRPHRLTRSRPQLTPHDGRSKTCSS